MIFEDSGVLNSSSFRIGKYIIPRDPNPFPNITGFFKETSPYLSYVSDKNLGPLNAWCYTSKHHLLRQVWISQPQHLNIQPKDHPKDDQQKLTQPFRTLKKKVLNGLFSLLNISNPPKNLSRLAIGQVRKFTKTLANPLWVFEAMLSPAMRWKRHVDSGSKSSQCLSDQWEDPFLRQIKSWQSKGPLIGSHDKRPLAYVLDTVCSIVIPSCIKTNTIQKSLNKS